MSKTYTVIGSWPFPIDMLRRDGAIAASPEDQKKIDELSSENAPSKEAIEISTKITLVLGEGIRYPNTARWESFGWRVIGSSLETDISLRRQNFKLGCKNFIAPFNANGFWVDDAAGNTVCECRERSVAIGLVELLNKQKN